MNKKEIRNRLFELQDLEYKKFHLNLMPGVDEDTVIGVRTPALRSLAKEIFKSGEYDDFLSEMPHKYYDEMNLHGFILCEMKDYDTVIAKIEEMLPYINNWATCDLISPKKAFKNNLDKLIVKINEWIKSTDTYTIRFGIEILMTFFLDDLFKPEYLTLVANVQSDEYYVNMMRAWYFATALAKQYDDTVKLIESKTLDVFTQNKSIQKARESYRITAEQKEYLNTFKVKR